MLVPISWLKEYVDIKLPIRDLMWKMTEVGLTCESYKKESDEIILDIEVTPNRPDWMSVVGIAREIAAITDSKMKTKPPKANVGKIRNPLTIDIKPDYKIVPRITSIIIKNVKVAPSPEWLQKRIKQVGLRPINNLVDITNYVLWTYGSLLHAFDYDKIRGHKMTVGQSIGGEPFRSLDSIDYKLPKNAIIIKDAERIIDLPPLKGGENTASYNETKNVLLHSVVVDPIITRRTSQTLKLRSDSSAIAERGLDPNSTLTALNYALALILELAGGEVASEIIDHKAKDFKPWMLSLSLQRLSKILGITIPIKEVINILSRLNLSPKLDKKEIICIIPTYRGDIKIEEDLIEEVARFFGYNNFPQTLPVGNLPIKKIPYFYDRSFEEKLKNSVASMGYNEAINLSLISKDLISKCQLPLDSHIKIANPVSRDYEYLRVSLIPSLLLTIKQNADFEKIKIFEYGKGYFGPFGKTKEPYKIAGAIRGWNFLSNKGAIDHLLSLFNIENFEIKPTLVSQGLWHPTKSGVIEKKDKMLGTFGEIHPKVLSNLDIKDKIYAFELDVETLKSLQKNIPFKEIPKYPAQVEDITLVLPNKVGVGDIIHSIKVSSKTISDAELIDKFKTSYTFRFSYQSNFKTLTDGEVAKARSSILKNLKAKFGVKIKK